MRFFSFLAPVVAVACGGGVSSVPSMSSEPPAGTTPAPAQPVAPPPPVIASPPPQPAAACDMSGPEKVFDSVPSMTRALQSAWDGCGQHPICPDAEPHLYFAEGPSAFAACGRWCSGDGGHCPTADPTYRFTYGVSSTPSGYVLELTNPSGTRRFTIRWWASDPMAAMALTDVDTATITHLQMVGIPVR